jgi:protein phosphatase
MIENGSQWIDTASFTHVGLVRSVNQDRYAERKAAGGRRLLVVADGMGGHRGGETASRLAVEAITEVFEGSEESLEVMMRTAVTAANQRIHEQANADPELAGMGTTVVALCLTEDGEAWVAHVGDSRLYVLRSGELDALTEDHSVVGELERQGFITAAEAQRHPRRNELTRSVGVAAALEVDLKRVSVMPGDRFLLCSDGLCGYVEDDEIREVLAGAEPRDAARELVARANAKGGYDNVTVQIVAVRDRAPASGEPSSEAQLPQTEEEPMERALVEPPRGVRPRVLIAIAATVVLVAACALWLLLQG